jgi:hypothetical protein
MNTKIVMTSSALFLAILGISLSFLPAEITAYFNVEPNQISILFLQILSAFYLGFGILNWMAKGALIGGIYNRPIAIGNLMHFGVGAIALVKTVMNSQTNSLVVIVITAIYIIFALLFGYIFRNNPAKV